MPPFTQTEEQRRRATEAAGTTVEALETAEKAARPTAVPSGIITGQTLTPSTTDLASQITQPQPTPVADISKLEIPAPKLAAPTPEADQASEMVKRFREITAQAGEAEKFRIEQEKAVGIPEAESVIEDLSSQLKFLKGEQEAGALDVETRISQLQQAAGGRGITAGGLAPQERGIRRAGEVAARERAYNAITLSARIDAANNLLGSAERKVERNLRLLIDSLAKFDRSH